MLTTRDLIRIRYIIWKVRAWCWLMERFEEVVFRAQTCLLDPIGHGLPRGLGDLELHRSRGLLLHADCPRGDAVAVADVADLCADEIASAQLAVDAKIEQCEISRSANQLEPDADRPDFFQLERRLLANQLALVPRFRVGTNSSFIHGEILKG